MVTLLHDVTDRKAGDWGSRISPFWRLNPNMTYELK